MTSSVGVRAMRSFHRTIEVSAARMSAVGPDDNPKISTLLPVNVRKVWPGEASDFTPWLLANADVLGEVLGIDLELQSAEHKVGSYSLDLIGRDTASDDVVIIENQFNATDHRHLGQLLTYAGGTRPAVVVWIAESFNEEHRAALDWLNLRTDNDTQFFGVQLKAVTLAGADGLVAPLLEVVVKPNEWGKAVHKSATNAPSAREELYVEFWTAWLTQVKPHHWTNRKGPRRHFLNLPTGAKRSRYVVSFRSDGIMSQLYFGHKDSAVNSHRFEVLLAKRAAIEAAFEGQLDFDPLPNRKGCRISTSRKHGESVENQSDWADYMNWFETTQVRLRGAIAAGGGIPPLPTGVADEGDDADLDGE